MCTEHEFQKEMSVAKDLMETYRFLKPHLEGINAFDLGDEQLDKLANDAISVILEKYHNFHTDSKEIQVYNYEWTPKFAYTKNLLQNEDIKLIDSSLKSEINIWILTALNAFIIYAFNNQIGDDKEKFESLVTSTRLFLAQLIEEESIHKFVENVSESETLEDKVDRLLEWLENILPFGLSVIDMFNNEHVANYPGEHIYPTVVYETIEGNIAVFYVTDIWLQEHAVYKKS